MVFMVALLYCRSDRLNRWPLMIELNLFPEGQGVVLKVPTSGHLVGSSGNQPPSSWGRLISSCMVERSLLTTKDTPLMSITQDVSRILETLCQE